MTNQNRNGLSRAEIRNGVKDGLVDHDLFGAGTLLVLFECVLVGVLVYFFSKDWNENLSTWLAWGSGILLFFLFFVPKIRGLLILIFSSGWALLGYTLAQGARNEFSGENADAFFLFSPSPIPYVVAIVIALISWGFHAAVTD